MDMNVTRYEPWLLMNRLSRDLDRLFNAPVEGGDESRSSVVDWLPAVDIKEEDKQFVLRADLPGVESKDIDITMEKGVLTLRGTRSTETRDERNGYRRVERVSGEFFRRFTLPDTADSQAIKAKHVNGVLEVVIPKQAAVLPRKISVATN
jgi:HSP20 family protein